MGAGISKSMSHCEGVESAERRHFTRKLICFGSGTLRLWRSQKGELNFDVNRMEPFWATAAHCVLRAPQGGLVRNVSAVLH